MKIEVRRIGGAMMLAAFALSAGGCQQETRKEAAAEALAFAPVAYYMQNCQHCHGPGASKHLKELQRLSDDDLRDTVLRMSEGFGNAPISGAQLHAVVAFHRAVIREEPFLAVTGIEGGVVRGEASGAEKLEARLGDVELNVELSNGQWVVNLPENADVSQLLLTAYGSNNESSVSFHPSEEPHTHLEPL